MKIGLVRHFKVNQKLPAGFLIGHQALVNWFDQYDNAEVSARAVDMLGINWELCYASTMSRAHTTAQHIYEGEIHLHDELHEVSVLNLLNKKLKLPVIIWAILIKRKTLSANSITEEAERKLDDFLDMLMLKKEKEILIVSHGFVMMLLEKKLRARGFSGQKINNPANGKIYLFDKAFD